jgi:ethanolamine ammonia-lyase small subunit
MKRPPPPPAPDPWQRFRAATRARIGLGRSGDALPTKALLEFEASHARARDAVHGAVDFDALAAQLDRPAIQLHSAAPDRDSYLRRPDLGRRLDAASREKLAGLLAEPADVVFIIADGLSTAVQRHALPLLRDCLPELTGWCIAPIVLAGQARVALGDEIGAGMKAALSVMLIGERPGLSVADSLGVYLTWDPKPGRTDAERNCISNIHAAGLSYRQATARLVWLMEEARHRRLSGVALKDEAALPPPEPRP